MTEAAACILLYEPIAPQMAYAVTDSPAPVQATFFSLFRPGWPLLPLVPPTSHTMPKPAALLVEILNVYASPTVKPAAGMSLVIWHASPAAASYLSMPALLKSEPGLMPVMSLEAM